MDARVSNAITLLEQAMGLLIQVASGAAVPAAGPQAAAPYAPVTPPVNLYGAPPRGDKPYVMPFGTHKGQTLEQIFSIDPSYLGWIGDKFGMNDDGGEDPKWAAKNAVVRAAAKRLLGTSNVPPALEAVGAYPVGEYETTPPAPAPEPAAGISDVGDEIPF